MDFFLLVTLMLHVAGPCSREIFDLQGHSPSPS